MDLLMNNPLADMYGPLFLLVYAVTIVVTVVLCRGAARRLDWTSRMPPPPLPVDPDPHEIAYLRGGENEVTRSVVFALVQRGLLRVAQTGKGYQVSRTTENPDRGRLTPIELRALDWFTRSRRPAEMFEPKELAAQLRPFCAAYEQRLQGERLLVTDDVRRTARLVALAGAGFVLALGAYKFVVAVAEGRFNVGFLVILAAVGVFVVLKLCRAPRVSGRGRAYLERLRLAFERLKYQAHTPRPLARTRDGEPAEAVNSFDPSLLLLVGVFGVGALAGTPFDSVERTFQRASAQGDSSGGGGGCGSSCGSSSDSSSSGGDSGGGGCGSSSCGGGGCGGGCGG